ncbi:MAG: hypothetical protein M3Y86_02400, partial [Verrucomicrobiota bacterium]|nr:hypothetical protein [Verrucomicrobiota bacterium]
ALEVPGLEWRFRVEGGVGMGGDHSERALYAQPPVLANAEVLKAVETFTNVLFAPRQMPPGKAPNSPLMKFCPLEVGDGAYI